MTTENTIPLNEDWLYFYATNSGNKNTPPQQKVSWIPLPHLADWVVTSSIQSGADWFRRKIDVIRPNNPMQYVMVFDHVPESVMLFINGDYVANLIRNRKANIDVTAHLHEGENTITMKVICDSTDGGGVFGNVSLQPINRASYAG